MLIAIRDTVNFHLHSVHMDKDGHLVILIFDLHNVAYTLVCVCVYAPNVGSIISLRFKGADLL